MPTHSRRAINPTPEELVAIGQELMNTAFRDAMSRTVIFFEETRPPSPAVPLWSEWLAHAELPSGVYARHHFIDWSYDPMLFGAAWWTDHIGRKHWVIQADSSGDSESIGSLADRDGEGTGWIEGRHPLEWICPKGSVGYRGPTNELMLICRCGFAGTPESLGWMGQSCGPCADREQEGLPAVEGAPSLRIPAHSVCAFRILPGDRLLTAEDEPTEPLTLRCWAPPYLGSPVWSRQWCFPSAWAISPKNLLAVAVQTRVTLLDVHTGRSLETREVGLGGGVSDLAFVGHEGQRLVVSFVSSTHAGRSFLRAWEITPEGHFGTPLYLQEGHFPAFAALSPKGQRLLVPHGRYLDLIDSSDGSNVDRLKLPQGGRFLSGCILPDGSVLASNHRDDRSPPAMHRWLPGMSGNGGILQWLRSSMGRSPETSLPLNHVCEDIVLAPNGREIATVEEGGVVIRNALTLQERSRFHPAGVRVRPPLAFTNDGHLIASLGRGVAVWPWKELFG